MAREGAGTASKPRHGGWRAKMGALHHALQAQRHARAGGSLHLASAMGLTGASAHACVVSIQIVRSQLMYIGA